MKKTTVTIPWVGGLHLRPAAKIVQLAQSFRSRVVLRFGSTVAEATSIMSLLVLCAAMNSMVEVEATGADEEEAICAIEELFESTEANQEDTGRESPKSDSRRTG